MYKDSESTKTAKTPRGQLSDEGRTPRVPTAEQAKTPRVQKSMQVASAKLPVTTPRPARPLQEKNSGQLPFTFKANKTDAPAGEAAALPLAKLQQQRAAKERRHKRSGAKEAMRRDLLHRPGVMPTAVSVQPKPEPRPTTVVAPFTLSTEARGRIHQEQQQLRVHEKPKEEARKAQLKAQPILTALPKPLNIASAPITVPVDVKLNSSKRAVERGHFDSRIKANEAKAKAREEERKREAQQLEEAAIKRCREGAVFRATPMPDFWSSPPKVSKSLKPPTKSKSPNLGQSKRRRLD